MERNMFLELDGLANETETHEWFHDKVGTSRAQNEDRNFIKLPHISCFVVRDKESGEYDRVVVDSKKREIIYDTKSVEELGFYIDKLKILKHFNSK
jgi:hypothetical protein